MSNLVYLTLLPPIILGVLLITWLVLPSRKGNILLFISLGIPAGFGVVSLLLFLWSLILSPSNPGFFLLETLIIAILAYLNWIQRDQLLKYLPDFKKVKKIEWLFIGLFLVVAIIGLITFINYTTANPNGRYDAWAIWNVRARMLARAGEFWKTVFIPQVFHADYPLMVPFSIAHSWIMAGTESARIPQAIAGLFTFSSAGILAGGLLEFKKKENAFLAGMILLCLPWFIFIGSKQFADIPQAACILASLASLSLYFMSSRDSDRWILIAGLFSGIAAWVKNEGQLFLHIFVGIVTVSIFIIFRRKQILRILGNFLVGLILPLLVLVAFKITLAPANDVVNSATINQSLTMLFSMDRYREVFYNLQLFHKTFGGLDFPFPLVFILAILLMKPRITKENKVPFLVTSAILLIQWIGYFAIYLITPHNLANHINTSYDRLLIHLYPSIIMVAFLLTTPFSDVSAPSKIEQETPAV